MFLLKKILVLRSELRRVAKECGLHKRDSNRTELCDKIKWYPSSGDAQSSLNSSRPAQVPPLMVRRAAWRK